MSILPCTLPLIQSPMAGVQDARLALAVSAAGALGSLPAALLSLEALERQLQTLQASGLPYNVNFFTHTPPVVQSGQIERWHSRLQPFYEALQLPLPEPTGAASRQPFGPQAAEVLEAFRPAVVSFHFGLPAPELLARVRRLGARILSSATTLEEALWLQAQGVDAVIAQGLEAGGHRGHFMGKDVSAQQPTLALLAQLVPALSVPVIAAGGIATAAHVRAAMERGAAGVQAGTAFLLCPEADTSALHRTRLKDAEAPTALTNLFSGGLARGLFNRALRELGPVHADAPPFPLATAAMAPLRARAEALGLDDFTPLWSGMNRQGLREVPAAEVVRALAEGLKG